MFVVCLLFYQVRLHSCLIIVHHKCQYKTTSSHTDDTIFCQITVYHKCQQRRLPLGMASTSAWMTLTPDHDFSTNGLCRGWCELWLQAIVSPRRCRRSMMGGDVSALRRCGGDKYGPGQAYQPFFSLFIFTLRSTTAICVHSPVVTNGREAYMEAVWDPSKLVMAQWIMESALSNFISI